MTRNILKRTLIKLFFVNLRHLARNPFHCDCRLTWIVDWMEDFPVETSGARCESPKRMHKKKLGTLRKEQLKCLGDYSCLCLLQTYCFKFCN